MELGISVPWLSDRPSLETFNGTFRANVKELLQCYGTPIVLMNVQDISAWVIPLSATNGSSVFLHVYEDRTPDAVEDAPACDCCRHMGWQHHLVATRQYHFIVAAISGALPKLIDIVEDRLQKSAPNMNIIVDASEQSKASVFENTEHHFMHGSLHANGFGHLHRMNAREIQGSARVSGQQLMTIWDSLCKLLAAREVSVEDVSNKSGMLLRMLHTVAYGSTWYGKWGYTFGRAPFNISERTYQKCVNLMRNLPLEDLLSDFNGVDDGVQHILSLYSQLSTKGSSRPLTTLGDLLQHMLKLVAHPESAANLFILSQPQNGGPSLPKSVMQFQNLSTVADGKDDAPCGSLPQALCLPFPVDAAAGPETPLQSTSSACELLSTIPKCAPVLEDAAAATGTEEGEARLNHDAHPSQANGGEAPLISNTAATATDMICDEVAPTAPASVDTLTPHLTTEPQPIKANIYGTEMVGALTFSPTASIFVLSSTEHCVRQLDVVATTSLGSTHVAGDDKERFDKIRQQMSPHADYSSSLHEQQVDIVQTAASHAASSALDPAAALYAVSYALDPAAALHAASYALDPAAALHAASYALDPDYPLTSCGQEHDDPASAPAEMQALYQLEEAGGVSLCGIQDPLVIKGTLPADAPSHSELDPPSNQAAPVPAAVASPLHVAAEEASAASAADAVARDVDLPDTNATAAAAAASSTQLVDLPDATAAAAAATVLGVHVSCYGNFAAEADDPVERLLEADGKQHVSLTSNPQTAKRGRGRPCTKKVVSTVAASSIARSTVQLAVLRRDIITEPDLNSVQNDADGPAAAAAAAAALSVDVPPADKGMAELVLLSSSMADGEASACIEEGQGREPSNAAAPQNTLSTANADLMPKDEYLPAAKISAAADVVQAIGTGESTDSQIDPAEQQVVKESTANVPHSSNGAPESDATPLAVAKRPRGRPKGTGGKGKNGAMAFTAATTLLSGSSVADQSTTKADDAVTVVVASDKVTGHLEQSPSEVQQDSRITESLADAATTRNGQQQVACILKVVAVEVPLQESAHTAAGSTGGTTATAVDFICEDVADGVTTNRVVTSSPTIPEALLNDNSFSQKEEDDDTRLATKIAASVLRHSSQPSQEDLLMETSISVLEDDQEDVLSHLKAKVAGRHCQEARLQRLVKMVLLVLQKAGPGVWLMNSLLSNALIVHVEKDRILVSILLNCVSNARVYGWAIYRSHRSGVKRKGACCMCAMPIPNAQPPNSLAGHSHEGSDDDAAPASAAGQFHEGAAAAPALHDLHGADVAGVETTDALVGGGASTAPTPSDRPTTSTEVKAIMTAAKKPVGRSKKQHIMRGQQEDPATAAAAPLPITSGLYGELGGPKNGGTAGLVSLEAIRRSSMKMESGLASPAASGRGSIVKKQGGLAAAASARRSSMKKESALASPAASGRGSIVKKQGGLAAAASARRSSMKMESGLASPAASGRGSMKKEGGLAAAASARRSTSMNKEGGLAAATASSGALRRTRVSSSQEPPIVVPVVVGSLKGGRGRSSSALKNPVPMSAEAVMKDGMQKVVKAASEAPLIVEGSESGRDVSLRAQAPLKGIAAVARARVMSRATADADAPAATKVSRGRHKAGKQAIAAASKTHDSVEKGHEPAEAVSAEGNSAAEETVNPEVIAAPAAASTAPAAASTATAAAATATAAASTAPAAASTATAAALASVMFQQDTLAEVVKEEVAGPSGRKKGGRQADGGKGQKNQQQPTRAVLAVDPAPVPASAALATTAGDGTGAEEAAAAAAAVAVPTSAPAMLLHAEGDDGGEIEVIMATSNGKDEVVATTTQPPPESCVQVGRCQGGRGRRGNQQKQQSSAAASREVRERGKEEQQTLLGAEVTCSAVPSEVTEAAGCGQPAVMQAENPALHEAVAMDLDEPAAFIGASADVETAAVRDRKQVPDEAGVDSAHGGPTAERAGLIANIGAGTVQKGTHTLAAASSGAEKQPSAAAAADDTTKPYQTTQENRQGPAVEVNPSQQVAAADAAGSAGFGNCDLLGALDLKAGSVSIDVPGDMKPVAEPSSSKLMTEAVKEARPVFHLDVAEVVKSRRRKKPDHASSGAAAAVTSVGHTPSVAAAAATFVGSASFVAAAPAAPSHDADAAAEMVVATEAACAPFSTEVELAAGVAAAEEEASPAKRPRGFASRLSKTMRTTAAPAASAAVYFAPASPALVTSITQVTAFNSTSTLPPVLSYRPELKEDPTATAFSMTLMTEDEEGEHATAAAAEHESEPAGTMIQACRAGAHPGGYQDVGYESQVAVADDYGCDLMGGKKGSVLPASPERKPSQPGNIIKSSPAAAAAGTKRDSIEPNRKQGVQEVLSTGEEGTRQLNNDMALTAASVIIPKVPFLGRPADGTLLSSTTSLLPQRLLPCTHLHTVSVEAAGHDSSDVKPAAGSTVAAEAVDLVSWIRSMLCYEDKALGDFSSEMKALLLALLPLATYKRFRAGFFKNLGEGANIYHDEEGECGWQTRGIGRVGGNDDNDGDAGESREAEREHYAGERDERQDQVKQGGFAASWYDFPVPRLVTARQQSMAARQEASARRKVAGREAEAARLAEERRRKNRPQHPGGFLLASTSSATMTSPWLESSPHTSPHNALKQTGFHQRSASAALSQDYSNDEVYEAAAAGDGKKINRANKSRQNKRSSLCNVGGSDLEIVEGESGDHGTFADHVGLFGAVSGGDGGIGRGQRGSGGGAAGVRGTGSVRLTAASGGNFWEISGGLRGGMPSSSVGGGGTGLVGNSLPLLGGAAGRQGHGSKGLIRMPVSMGGTIKSRSLTPCSTTPVPSTAMAAASAAPSLWSDQHHIQRHHSGAAGNSSPTHHAAAAASVSTGRPARRSAQAAAALWKLPNWGAGIGSTAVADDKSAAQYVKQPYGGGKSRPVKSATAAPPAQHAKRNIPALLGQHYNDMTPFPPFLSNRLVGGSVSPGLLPLRVACRGPPAFFTPQPAPSASLSLAAASSHLPANRSQGSKGSLLSTMCTASQEPLGSPADILTLSRAAAKKKRHHRLKPQEVSRALWLHTELYKYAVSLRKEDEDRVNSLYNACLADFPDLPKTYISRLMAANKDLLKFPGSSEDIEHSRQAVHLISRPKLSKRSIVFEPELPDWRSMSNLLDKIREPLPLPLFSHGSNVAAHYDDQLLAASSAAAASDSAALTIISADSSTDPSKCCELMQLPAGNSSSLVGSFITTSTSTTVSGQSTDIAAAAGPSLLLRSEAVQKLRDQVQCHLQYLYSHIIREYSPVLVAVNRLAIGVPASTLHVKQRKVPSIIQVLMDTKCFVKNYSRFLSRPSSQPLVADTALLPYGKAQHSLKNSNDLRGMLTSSWAPVPLPPLVVPTLVTPTLNPKPHNMNVMVPAMAPPHSSNWNAAASAGHQLAASWGLGGLLPIEPPVMLTSTTSAAAHMYPATTGTPKGSCRKLRLWIQIVGLPAEVSSRRKIDLPPAEMVLVPQQGCIADLRRLASEALADTYKMFNARDMSGDYAVAVIGGIPPENLAMGDAFPVAGLPEGHTIEVMMTGYKTDPMFKPWRHSGGVEDWEAWCEKCRTMDDDGQHMIKCDSCGVWQHSRCCGISDDTDEADLPRTFYCGSCSSRQDGGAAGDDQNTMPVEVDFTSVRLNAGEQCVQQPPSDVLDAGSSGSAGGREPTTTSVLPPAAVMESSLLAGRRRTSKQMQGDEAQTNGGGQCGHCPIMYDDCEDMEGKKRWSVAKKPRTTQACFTDKL
ncbi:hypothetical protein CEUSTIGMA_g6054.t1 [Chlamydomonas eustigma]|uniref:PHD-type domain-containing protein n=1 Tax=Chlamydomonas eustigma TaxID=1157962 RepID=A0A250X6C3_9CHLO|nr:hypothetical protein CEUSTIGMA_g6054.t1 [Chlamydomonas eustigma]|eukprot:GAX78615.1 hypothetical protein CEUSTIGMA_g6054.t1 [Chlamydomonas eustigma]